MLKSIKGVYRNGKIELLEAPPSPSDARVLITFLSTQSPIELSSRGIDKAQAADLRARLSSIQEDWDRPEMDVYDEV